MQRQSAYDLIPVMRNLTSACSRKYQRRISYVLSKVIEKALRNYELLKVQSERGQIKKRVSDGIEKLQSSPTAGYL